MMNGAAQLHSGAAIVVVRTVELRPERTRIKAVGNARAVRAVTLYAAMENGELVVVEYV